MPSTVPRATNCGDAFHRRSSRTRCTPRILYPRAPGTGRVRRSVGEPCALRYGTPDGPSATGRACADPHEIRAAMRVCGHHALHSSDRSGGSLCRARRRESRVCDTRGRPRGGPRERSSRPAAFPRAGWAAGSRPRSQRGELAAVRRSPAVAGAEIAETSSADAIISQGVALSGADALQRSGHDGSGITIVVLDQAFGAASRLNALAGTRAAADRAPAPADVRRRPTASPGATTTATARATASS